jgi:hypothetical protein
VPGRAADAEPGGASAGVETIPERLIEALRRPAAYAHDPSAHDPSAHVWLERDDATPLLIDCLEFSDALRHIDAAADVGLLAMEAERLGIKDNPHFEVTSLDAGPFAAERLWAATPRMAGIAAGA